MWAVSAKPEAGATDGKAARSVMMAAALVMDAPSAVAIGHVFGAQ
jgi:hypothetical protein